MSFKLFIAAALAGTTIPALAPAQTAPRPLEHFAELPALVGPKISPNGKLIAAQAAVKGKQYLVVLSVEGGAPKLIATGDNDLNWWRWVNDGWLVVGVGNKVPVPYLGEWYVRRALGVSATGDKVVPLLTRTSTQIADNLIWTANDGSPRVLLSMQRSLDPTELAFWPEVHEVDVSTGGSKVVVGSRDGVFNWTADGSGTVRMGIGQSLDGRSTRVLYRPAAGAPFKEVVRPTRDRNLILPTLFLPDPAKALAFADDDAGYTGLYEYDLATLKIGTKLHGSPGYDIAGMNPTRDRTAVAAVSYLENGRRTQWLDRDLASMDQEVTGLVKGGSARIDDFTRDQQRAIVFVGASNSPGAYYVFDRPSGSMNLLGYANPVIRAGRLNPVRTIRYKARDGLEIAAVLTMPRGKTGKLPLIVLPHGGPFARDSEEWDWWTQSLAERGYAVVQPNYRGSSGYGTAFTKKGEGQWGLAMQDDLNDAIAHLAGAGIADAGRVCIAGASYGGYAAMRAAQRDPKLYRCAISYAGVSDLDRLRRYDAQFLSAGVRADWLRLQATDFRAVSPIHTPTSFGIPVLLMHGRKDEVVPINQSREMAEKLKRAGKDVTWIEQPQADHHFTRGEDRLQFLKEMHAFLEKHNPA